MAFSQAAREAEGGKRPAAKWPKNRPSLLRVGWFWLPSSSRIDLRFEKVSLSGPEGIGGGEKKTSARPPAPHCICQRGEKFDHFEPTQVIMFDF